MLIGDLYSYAWVVLERQMAEREQTNSWDSATSAFPPVQYTDNKVEALKACSNPLTHYKHDEDPGASRLFEAPVDAGDGWAYSNRAMKEGWLFDFIQMNSTASARRKLALRKIPRKRRQRPTTPAIPGEIVLPGVVILPSELTFNVSFGSALPTLVISYLRSYEHFGKAVVIFDGDVQTAAMRIRKGILYREKYCDLAEGEVSRNGGNALQPPCMQMRHGFMEDPFVLNGHWSDHSSQLAVAVFNRNYELAVGPFNNYLEPHVFVPGKKALVTQPGWHTVSFAMLRDERDSPKDPARQKRSRFKIFALKTC